MIFTSGVPVLGPLLVAVRSSAIGSLNCPFIELSITNFPSYLVGHGGDT